MGLQAVLASCQPIRYFTHIEAEGQQDRQREVTNKMSELQRTIHIIKKAEPKVLNQSDGAALLAVFALAAFGYIGRSYFTNSPMTKAVSTVSMTTGLAALFLFFSQVILYPHNHTASKAYEEALSQLKSMGQQA